MTTAISPYAYFAGLNGNVSSGVIDTQLNLLVTALNGVNQYTLFGMDTGAVNAYAVTAVSLGGSALTASLSAGLGLWWTAANTSTSTTPTLSVAGTTATKIVGQDLNDLSVGDIVAGRTYFCIYNGTNWVLSGSAGVSIVNEWVTQAFTLSGFGSTPGGNMRVTRTNNVVTMALSGPVSALSTQNYMVLTFTGSLPADYRPTVDRLVQCVVQNNSQLQPASAFVQADGSGITFSVLNYSAPNLFYASNGFSAFNTKGVTANTNIIYSLT